MPEFICQYGNCEETDTPIVISNRKRLTKERFCCEEHAVLCLLGRGRDVSLATYDRIAEQRMKDFP